MDLCDALPGSSGTSEHKAVSGRDCLGHLSSATAGPFGELGEHRTLSGARCRELRQLKVTQHGGLGESVGLGLDEPKPGVL